MGEDSLPERTVSLSHERGSDPTEGLAGATAAGATGATRRPCRSEVVMVGLCVVMHYAVLACHQGRLEERRSVPRSACPCGLPLGERDDLSSPPRGGMERVGLLLLQRHHAYNRRLRRPRTHQRLAQEDLHHRLHLPWAWASSAGSSTSSRGATFARQRRRGGVSEEQEESEGEAKEGAPSS